MSYTIVKTDGAVLTTIANGTINTTSTSISLPGRNYAGYGEYLDTNFVHMLENFADTTVPSNPIRGQLWYNTSTSTMCICPADGETTAANWYTITTTSSGGNATFGNLTITGNLLANNITATNELNANSISCNYLTVNVNATMANANFSGTANAATFKTTAITSGAQATNGTLTGVWTANGAGTVSPYNGVSFYVTGGNLVISNASSRGIVADFFYYSNGSPITFGGSYSNSNVAAFLPTYGGAILTTTTTATALTTGGAATVGTLTGNWVVSGGSKLQANTVLDAAQPNITSVGTLSSLNVTANIVAGNVFANSGIIKAQYLTGDGSNITNIAVAAGTSIVNGTSNVVVDASGNTRIGIAGTSNVLVVASGGANITGYANVTTNAFIGGNANVVSNVNAGNFVGIFANGTSNVRIPAVNGNVNISSAGNANILVVTGTGVNVAGYANVTGTVFVGANANVVSNVNAGNFVGPLANGTSNVNIITNGNVGIVRSGTTRVLATGTGVNIEGPLTVANGKAIVGAVTYANTDGTAGQVLTTYGNGITYWSTAAGGATSYIANGTSNVYLSVANGPIVANTGGTTRVTIANANVTLGVDLVVSNANVSTVQNGNSNVRIAGNGNVTTSVGGTSNVLIVTTTGINVAGTLNTAAGNANVGNLGVAGNVLLSATSPYVTLQTTSAGNKRAGIVYKQSATDLFLLGTDYALANVKDFFIYDAPAAAYRLFIDTNGNVGIGGNIAPTHKLSVTGTTSISGNLDVNGNILANADVIAYSSSDSRLKENIVPIENALDKIKKISGVMFDWKDGHEIDRKHDTGLIAQEVEEVLPEVVVTRPSGYKAVRYEKIMGLVVQAIKELSDQVDELRNKL
jgi:hypothetical protein